MVFPVLAIIAGIAVLVWSADKFVDGSAAVARHFGLSPLLIGMVVVGFGTSVPEMVVSAFSALEGNPGLALGNAYGSSIANIALILGFTALLRPLQVDSRVMNRELPLLVGVTGLAIWLTRDGYLGRGDASVMLLVFGGLMVLAVRQARSRERCPGVGGGPGSGAAGSGVGQDVKLGVPVVTPKRAAWWIVAGLLLLVASSRLLVWGAVEVARGLGVSDLIIGLTIVAIGTSLPELASSVAAVRKGEHELALGNVLGSNLCNTLVVVGMAAMIRPMDVMPEVIHRDLPVMTLLTLSLFALGYGFKGPGTGRIGRIKGGGLMVVFFGYVTYLVLTVAG